MAGCIFSISKRFGNLRDWKKKEGQSFNSLISQFLNSLIGNKCVFLFEGVLPPRLIPSAVFYLLSNKGFDPEPYSRSEIVVLAFWKRNLGRDFKKKPLSPDSLAIRDSKNKIIPLVIVGGVELGDIFVFENPFGIQSLK